MFDPTLTLPWIQSADNSYIATRLLWFTGFKIESPVMAHSAIEKYLKAFLVSYGVKIVKGSSAWGHNLSELSNACTSYDTDFQLEQLNRRLAFYERYFYYVRYPSDLHRNSNYMLWFSFDSNITLLDEIVAFIRPRVLLKENEWKDTALYQINRAEAEQLKWKKRALQDNNEKLNLIDCEKTNKSRVAFNSEFSFDIGNC